MTETSHLQTYAKLAARSGQVRYTFPDGPQNRLVDVCGDDLQRQAQVTHFANTTYPIVHSKLRVLAQQFLELKRTRGTTAEQRLYATMDAAGLFDRCLRNRPLAFLNPRDSYLLTTGERGTGGFEDVGTEQEKAPLLLEQVLSYDEMQLAALIGVSVPTRFINNGARDNRGRPAPLDSFEQTGVYTGLVGARFERTERMEWQHMLVTAAQNQAEHGYGPYSQTKGRCRDALLACWATFYGLSDGFPLHHDVMSGALSPERFLKLGFGVFLDAVVYQRRLRMSIEPFLLDAAARAKKAGRKAYVHVVGLGLGVWQIDERQGQLMCDVYAQLLKEHSVLQTYISDLDFSWFPRGCDVGGHWDGDTFGEITIHFSRRNPAEQLNDARLLVAMYAWDSNAYPGNEYWLGALAASGDPAAACCSMISELQNPDINRCVSGAYTRDYS